MFSFNKNLTKLSFFFSIACSSNPDIFSFPSGLNRVIIDEKILALIVAREEISSESLSKLIGTFFSIKYSQIFISLFFIAF